VTQSETVGSRPIPAGWLAGCSSSMQLPLPTGNACAVSQPSSLSLNQAVAAQRATTARFSERLDGWDYTTACIKYYAFSWRVCMHLTHLVCLRHWLLQLQLNDHQTMTVTSDFYFYLPRHSAVNTVWWGVHLHSHCTATNASQHWVRSSSAKWKC